MPTVVSPTKAHIGYGAEFRVEAPPFGAVTLPPDETMILVTELQTLAEPERSKDAVEVTHYNSIAGYREFISGLKDGGEIPLEFSNVPSDEGQQALEAGFEYDGAIWWSLIIPTVPDKWRWSGLGIVTGGSGDVPLDDKMTRSRTLKITGQPVLEMVVIPPVVPDPPAALSADLADAFETDAAGRVVPAGDAARVAAPKSPRPAAGAPAFEGFAASTEEGAR
jgi:predicted secreted protein